MKPETLRLLEEADDPVGTEFPKDGGGEDLWRRIQGLVAPLERIVGRPLRLDEGVQDASFATDIALVEEEPKGVYAPVLAVRFSNFGRLFTVWSSSGTPDPDLCRRIVETVRAEGFVYIEEAELSEPYTRRNPHLKDTTWWIRFFDYL